MADTCFEKNATNIDGKTHIEMLFCDTELASTYSGKYDDKEALEKELLKLIEIEKTILMRDIPVEIDSIGYSMEWTNIENIGKSCVSYKAPQLNYGFDYYIDKKYVDKFYNNLYGNPKPNFSIFVDGKMLDYYKENHED